MIILNNFINFKLILSLIQKLHSIYKFVYLQEIDLQMMFALPCLLAAGMLLMLGDELYACPTIDPQAVEQCISLRWIVG